ncbi:hypothetical protein MWH03_00200 [Klebsiella pneumoniae]|nr:hypothetical protein [Klebsiella pneumoniae]
MILTEKQESILRCVWIGHERGSLVDLDELLSLLPYRTTKASIQFSIRILIRKGLLIRDELGTRKEDKYRRRRLSLTPHGTVMVKLMK